MEISDLEIFRTVVQAGGITRAAAKLHRVPSNVTTRVRQLEEGLGVRLFLREGKRLQLSPAGRVLLDYAERILDLAKQAREALEDSPPRGPLRLGTMESTAATRLPEPLSAYHRRYPDVTLELRTGPTQELVAQVLAGELDAALVADPIKDARLGSILLYEEELVIVAEARHPPIKLPKDVPSRTLLAFRSGCVYRKRLEDWFAHHRMVPERIVEVSSYYAILGCAVAGMGIALLPRSVLAIFPGRDRLSVHPLSGSVSKSKTLFLWRNEARTAKIDALANILSSLADTVVVLPP